MQPEAETLLQANRKRRKKVYKTIILNRFSQFTEK
jgi:hypothetical protein